VTNGQASPGAGPTSILPPLLLLGGGRMGSAMLAGWLERGLSNSVVVDPLPAIRALSSASVTVVASTRDIPAGFAPAAVVLAVKPQFAAEAIPPCAPFATGAVVLSIMAGKRIGWLRETLGTAAAVVRAMPNTPAAIRRGVTVACAEGSASAAQRELAETLLAAVGRVAWVEDEALIDPVTAVSGGGPAYVFLLAELLERAAVEQGLPPDLSRLLARETISGAGALLAADDADASELRRAVTSPKGTTERALAVLMSEGAWPRLVSEAVAAATARSRELGG
jgi:pyrroline-5-carboxylate reductase